ncbi:MAG: pirin family protein, partial [Myxococcales bacterium]
MVAAGGAAGASLWLPGCREPGASQALIAAPELERAVTRVVPAQPTTDGAGVKLHRALGQRTLAMLDPFLMLDEFYTDRPEDYVAGFPDHPHRGFETVTYMVHGAMEHRDSLGNRGRLEPGSVQWMTAGRGIIHSEMPKQHDGLMWGFQLWVNLPAAQKMNRPRYQDIAPGRVREASLGEATARVVAGEVGGVRGPVEGVVTAPLMLDVKVPGGGRARARVPAGHSAFAYVFEGVVQLGGREGPRVQRGNLAVLSPGDVVTATSEQGGRFLLLAAAPIGESVARQGPFVMNTDAEIRQAVDDYRRGRLVVDGLPDLGVR